MGSICGRTARSTVAEALSETVWQGRAMRWDELFEDLEAQAEAQDAVEREDLVAEVDAAESARLLLLDRLGRGDVAKVALASGLIVEGAVADVGVGWFLLRARPRELLVALRGVEWLEGATRADPDRERTARRLGLGHVLRGLAAREVEVVVETRNHDVAGTVTRTGADHVDVESDRGRVTSVPWDAIVSVAI